MAGPLVSLACTHPSSPLPSSPFRNFQPNSSQPPQHLTAAFRRSSHLGTGKQSECGHGVWANPLASSHSSLRAIFNSEKESSASANDDENDVPPAGCSRIKVEFTKPLGIAFEEDKFGNIFVDEVLEGGNAYKSGLIEAGDQLIATSAVVYGSEEDYQGVMVRKGMQIVRLNVRGERFETVMAAIGTHPAYIKVAMEFQKCKPLLKDSLNGSTRS